MTSEERQEYAGEVIRAVYGCDPEEARVSSADFAEVQRWIDNEIPLRVALQAISELPKRPSIRYCAPAVKAEWERGGVKALPADVDAEDLMAAVYWVGERGGKAAVAEDVFLMTTGSSNPKHVRAALKKAGAPEGVYALIEGEFIPEAK